MKMRKTKEQPILENVLITDIGAEGKAIARIDGMVLFVPFVVPGDIADIKIIKKKKTMPKAAWWPSSTTPTNAQSPNAPISAPAAAAGGKTSTMPTSWQPSSSR